MKKILSRWMKTRRPIPFFPTENHRIPERFIFQYSFLFSWNVRTKTVHFPRDNATSLLEGRQA